MRLWCRYDGFITTSWTTLQHRYRPSTATRGYATATSAHDAATGASSTAKICSSRSTASPTIGSAVSRALTGQLSALPRPPESPSSGRVGPLQTDQTRPRVGLFFSGADYSYIAGLRLHIFQGPSPPLISPFTSLGLFPSRLFPFSSFPSPPSP